MKMSASAIGVERSTGRVEDQGLLFEYTIKLVLFVGFFELVLYRLVSRLGMHISKIAAQHEWVGSLFKLLTSVGFALLNVVAIFVFLALVVLLVNRIRTKGIMGFNLVTVPSVALLLILTGAFLMVQPAMLGSIAYNVVTIIALTSLMLEYLSQQPEWSKRIMGVVYYFGISGWLYYQIFSTTYGWMGVLAAPPLVYEANRLGEALMVLASILVFWAYGRGVSFRTRNKQQRRRALWFGAVSGVVFFGLLFMDYFLGLYNPALAHSIRQAGGGSTGFSDGHGLYLLPSLCLLCRWVVVLVVHGDSTRDHGTRGRLWSRLDVYCRLRTAVFQFDLDGGTRGHVVDARPSEGYGD
ncbi:MAG: hypothetical protein MRJ92_07555 [Nitrospira sp.]|nr:hypothetical protein [Nitrospira sp.]